MSKKLSKQFESNREIILKTAGALFCSKGVGATSISDIAKAAKLSKGTVSYYFPTKDHLVFEATEHHLDDVSDSVLGWMDAVKPETQLSSVLVSLFACLFHVPEKCRLHICLCYEAMMGNSVIEKMISETTMKWQTMVEAGLVKAGLNEARRITETFFILLDTVIFRQAMGILDLNEMNICDCITKYFDNQL